jgi:ABC-type amino acid transport substrate-binding protein
MTTSRGFACLDRFLVKLSIVFLAFFTLGTLSARAEDRVVTVGIYENMPKVFTSKAGMPAGIFIDIIENIAKSEGWDLHYVSGTWAEGLDRLAKGEIDLMPDVAYTTDREKIYSFHKVPVLSSWSQIYARKNSGIRSIMDLDGKRIMILEGSVQQEAFSRLSEGFGLKITLIPAPDYKKAFEMVAKNEADAAVSNNFFGLMHTKEYGLEDTAVVFSPTKLLFAAPRKASKSILDIIDRRLAELKENPESVYYASLKRWTSEEVTFKLPLWTQIIGLVIGGVLIMSLVAGAILSDRSMCVPENCNRRMRKDRRHSSGSWISSSFCPMQHLLLIRINGLLPGIRRAKA